MPIASGPVRRSALVVLAGVLCACTAAQVDGPGAAAPTSATTSPAAGSTSTTATPPASGTSPVAPTAASTSSAEPPAQDAPLALAAHPSRGPVDVSPAVARAVVAGRVADWSRLGLPRGRLRVVAGPAVDAPGAARARSDAAAVRKAANDPAVLALVPTSALGPTVRAVLIGGRSPLRAPRAYPLRTAGQAPPAAVTMTVVGDVMLARRVAAASGDDPAAPLRPLARRLA
ncbi:hypothetical protein G9H71_21610, partial [Motilibacter sp. E257]